MSTPTKGEKHLGVRNTGASFFLPLHCIHLILPLSPCRPDALLQCEEPLQEVCKWPLAGSGQEAALGAGE